jgi:DNA-binding LacI/PurR family transcriptional regulator
MARRAATIKDVAELAGVSVATVSAVVNEHKKKVPLSAKSRKRVKDAIKELNYRVNNQARVLRTGRSYTIGVIASDLTQPFTAASISCVEKEANGRDYSFLLSDIQNNKEKEKFYLDLFRQKEVEGILFIGASNEYDDEAIVSIIENGVPVVLTEREIEGDQIPCVLVDNEKGGYLATKHLIERGHSRICYVAGPASNLLTHERHRGYLRALAEHGLSQHDRIEQTEGMGLEEGYRAAKRLIERENNRPTAVFAFNDTIAIGAIRAIREVGIAVPGEMAIVGFDDIPMAAYSQPALTTVRQPRVRLCHIGVKMLLDILEGKYPERAYAKIVLQPELVVRDSS